MPEKLRFGIVGCGVIAATHLHLARDDQKEVGAYGIAAPGYATSTLRTRYPMAP